MRNVLKSQRISIKFQIDKIWNQTPEILQLLRLNSWLVCIIFCPKKCKNIFTLDLTHKYTYNCINFNITVLNVVCIKLTGSTLCVAIYMRIYIIYRLMLSIFIAYFSCHAIPFENARKIESTVKTTRKYEFLLKILFE